VFFNFVFYWGRILDGWVEQVFEKKIVLGTEKGEGGIIAHYCAIPPSQPPFISYNISQYISPTTPFIAIKYWQYLVRAKQGVNLSSQGFTGSPEATVHCIMRGTGLVLHPHPSGKTEASAAAQPATSML